MNFILSYVLKIVTVSVVEKLAIILLQHLVTKTESKIDDQILEVVKQAIDNKSSIESKPQ